MPQSAYAESDSAQATVYEIRLEGHLEPRWTAWFGDVTITLEGNSRTLLSCHVTDQAALYGLLRKVRDLGLPLVSVTRIGAGAEAIEDQAPNGAKLVSPLQVELFVKDLDASIDFYTRVLGFTMGTRQIDGYTPLQNGPVRLSLNAHASLAADHPVQVSEGERPGRGVEFVLWADDLQTLYALVQEQGWPISAEMKRRPWRLDDFRLQDPDGFYLRFTSKA